MSNSKLVSMTKLSPNHSGKRTHKIDRITPHCFVGQVTVEQGLNCFLPVEKDASCNYVIGKDGKIGLCVDEGNRSWCSSSESNDQRAVTIETASDAFDPYAITDAAWKALIKLCVDICKRNGKKKLLWFGDKNKTLNYSPKSDEMIISVHRWFAAKSCPGDYIYSRLGTLAKEVTKQLTKAATVKPAKKPTVTKKHYLVKVATDALNIRRGPSTKYSVAGVIRDRGVYTIVETRGSWGKLKSGAGWISLDWVKKC